MSEQGTNPRMEEEAAKGPESLGLLDALLLGPKALLQVFRAPAVLALVYLCITLPSFLLLTSYYQSLNSVLAGNPLANEQSGLLLLADFDRLHPGGQELPGLMQIVWALVITFFAGGLLSTVGLGRKPRPGLSGFLSESGRLFFRSFRTNLPSLFLIMVWTWIFVVLLQPWVMGLGLVQASDARAYWVGFGLNVLFLFGFGKILILRRLALARLVHAGRRSALISWAWAIRYWMRHPLVTIVAYLPIFLIFAAGAYGAVKGLDALLADYFEPDSRPIYFMLATQVFPIFYLALNLASFLVARHLVAIETAIREGVSTEPRIVVTPTTSKTKSVESLAKEPGKSPEEGTSSAKPESPEEALAWEWTPEEPAETKD